jgi:hypothetical protein
LAFGGLEKRMAEISVRVVDPTTPAAAELLAALDAYQSALYPPASVHLVPAAALAEVRKRSS